MQTKTQQSDNKNISAGDRNPFNTQNSIKKGGQILP
jgi:hypothetical protein